MSDCAAASQEYLKNAVMTAKPEQLQVMLLDGAVRYALRGQQALRDKDHEGSFNNLDRAQRICLQLSAGLNRDVNPGLVDQMSALYNYCYMRLIDANLQRDPDAVDDAVRVLKHQRETWALIVDKLAKDGPVQTPGPMQAGSAVAVTPDDDAPTVNFEG